MNCQRFQEQLEEYLDGALSSREQAAVEQHLEACDACRQATSERQQFGAALAGRLRSCTGLLTLPPEARRRIIAALGDGSASRPEPTPIVSLWQRLAWPLALAAGVVLAGFVAVRFIFPVQGSREGAVFSRPHMAPGGVSIHVTYATPTYVFRREGALVTDVLTWQTTVVNQRLWAIDDPRPPSNE